MNHNQANGYKVPKGTLLLIGGHEDKSACDNTDKEHPNLEKYFAIIESCCSAYLESVSHPQ
jgi:hypothetical protein